METVCQELGIPRKQIRQTKRANRFVVIVHKAWLKCLSQQQSLAKFPAHPGFDEWPSDVEHIGQDWSLAYFTIYRKHGHKVIPLPSVRKDANTDADLIASFGHLLQHISSANHRNGWKDAYAKYATQRTTAPTKDTINRTERNTVNLVAYDAVLLEAIIRAYGCNVLHAKLDKMMSTGGEPAHSADKKPTAEPAQRGHDTHPNLYPITGCIETTSHYVLVYGHYLANSLADCITYSPAILDKSYNKPLFIIYQLLQLIKTLHDRGLFLGNIGLDDVFVTENMWLQVMPQLHLNILRSTDQTLDTPSSAQLINLAGDSVPAEMRWSLRDYCTMWCNGQLSNFDYLSILNNLSGRRIGDPSFHHIMPWVTDFVSRGGLNWRDLTKSKYRLNKGDTQLDLMFVPPPSDAMRNMNPHHVSDVLSEITYYVYMARRTPKSVLCKHVRPIWVPHEYPVSIARLYNWTPDECIPEFFSDPLVFKSMHEDLPDLEIPSWSSCPEDFITKHREALESQYVSERLHHWIDLNFGYKLSGNAAIKSKNVYLSMIDNHQNLCRRGIVQLFGHPHPPRQYQTAWTAKTPPRIYSQTEMRRRLTRSTDDLSNKLRTDELTEPNGSGQATTHARHSPSLPSSVSISSTNPPNISAADEAASSSMERSPSLHSNVHRSTNRILLPRDYNPTAALTMVENMHVFRSKTFYGRANAEPIGCVGDAAIHADASITDEGINAFTNRIFAERFEEGQARDSKRLHNHKNYAVQNSTRNFRQIVGEQRQRELKVLGCMVVELFLANKLRPINGIGATAVPSLDDRIAACQNVLGVEVDALPKCVRYPVQLLFDASAASAVITDLGLPKPSANQLLQLFLSNCLFPFPHEYLTVYTLLRSLYQYDWTNRLLDLHTYFECDGSNCRRFVSLDKQRTVFRRKIAECKVMAGAAQLEQLLIARGFEQFNVVDLVWPNIVELITAEGTAILAAWFLFDSIAAALGPYRTKQHLLEPILKLYDAESIDRVAFLNSNMDATIKFTTGAAFKSRKTIKLYHHSFLLRLVVRFGLKCFLDNFVPPLIEAIGGYKEPVHHSYYHYHDTSGRSDVSARVSKTIKMCVDLESSSFARTLPEEEMFAFDADVEDSPPKPLHTSQADSSDNDVDGMSRNMDHFDLNTTDESVLDIQLNHSNAMEVTEETSEELLTSIEIPAKPDRRHSDAKSSGREVVSPTIAIPSSSKHSQLSTIDCDIGSKISTDEADLLEAAMLAQANDESAGSIVSPIRSSNASDTQTQYQISDMSAESIIWLSHRLGPVLTARHLTRNLLKMLTLCYMGQENLMPDLASVADNSRLIHDNLVGLSIADGRVAGDRLAVKVLECLTSISSIYGDHFILLQYFSHITELIALCKKRITASLEGGLISSLQLLKYIVPCLSDSVIMDQLHDTILKSIIHPIIRFIGSTRFLMPNGFLARSVLARKLLDAIYVLAVRIGPEMTKNHLCVPALQRFFLIFDKSHGITDHLLNDPNDDSRGSPSFDDSSFIEIRRDGGTKEWSVKGSPIQIRHARTKDDNAVNSITPPKQDEDITPIATYRERALEEIKEVFTPQLAHVSYVPFLKFLGDHIMKQFMKNLPLILTLCHEYERPEYASLGHGIGKADAAAAAADVSYTDGPASGVYSSSFGTAMIGNRIGVHVDSDSTEIGPMEILDLVSHKFDQINATRHLRGNWLAYWEHEIGRPEKNAQFNVKQIKLQTYAGHTSSVRSMLCLDNENSFMSASKDKTVKLWSLRSEGDGAKVSSCQFTYANHRKSVHSLAFLDALRLTVSCDSSVHIWDPFVGSEVGQLDSARLPPVSVVRTYPAPSALILAGTADATLRIIDARTVSYVNEWKLSMGQASSSVRCIAVAPSGKWVAVALSSGQISLCDGQTGILIAAWKHTDGELLQLIALNEGQIISTSLDHSVCVWSTLDGTLLYQLKNPNEPIHVLLCNQTELIFGTPANRIGVYSSIQASAPYSITKLRAETIKGVLTSMAILPLNRMLLVGGDSGMISLLC